MFSLHYFLKFLKIAQFNGEFNAATTPVWVSYLTTLPQHPIKTVQLRIFRVNDMEVNS